MIDASFAWYASRDLKRNAPDLVKSCMRDYLADQDSLQNYVTSHCETGPSYRVSTAVFVHSYCKLLNNPISNRVLVPRMKAKGF